MSQKPSRNPDEHFESKEQDTPIHHRAKKTEKHETELCRMSISDPQKDSPKSKHICKHETKKTDQMEMRHCSHGQYHGSASGIDATQATRLYPNNTTSKKIERQIIWKKQRFDETNFSGPERVILPKFSSVIKKSQSTVHMGVVNKDKECSLHSPEIRESSKTGKVRDSIDSSEKLRTFPWAEVKPTVLTTRYCRNSFPPINNPSEKIEIASKKDALKKKYSNFPSREKILNSPKSITNPHRELIEKTSAASPGKKSAEEKFQIKRYISQYEKGIEAALERFKQDLLYGENNRDTRKKRKTIMKNYKKQTAYNSMGQNEPYVGLALFQRKKEVDTGKEEQRPDSDVIFEDQIKENARRLIIQIIFLILVSTIAIGMTSIENYYFTDLTEELFYKTPPKPPRKNDTEDYGPIKVTAVTKQTKQATRSNTPSSTSTVTPIKRNTVVMRGSIRPGVRVTSMRPGVRVTGGRPGVRVTGRRPGVRVTSIRPGVRVTGGRPGVRVTGRRPGVRVTSKRPKLQRVAQITMKPKLTFKNKPLKSSKGNIADNFIQTNRKKGKSYIKKIISSSTSTSEGILSTFKKFTPSSPRKVNTHNKVMSSTRSTTERKPSTVEKLTPSTSKAEEIKRTTTKLTSSTRSTTERKPSTVEKLTPSTSKAEEIKRTTTKLTSSTRSTTERKPSTVEKLTPSTSKAEKIKRTTTKLTSSTRSTTERKPSTVEKLTPSTSKAEEIKRTTTKLTSSTRSTIERKPSTVEKLTPSTSKAEKIKRTTTKLTSSTRSTTERKPSTVEKLTPSTSKAEEIKRTTTKLTSSTRSTTERKPNTVEKLTPSTSTEEEIKRTTTKLTSSTRSTIERKPSTVEKLTPSTSTIEEIIRSTSELIPSTRSTTEEIMKTSTKLTSSTRNITEGKPSTAKKLTPSTRSTTEKIKTSNKLTPPITTTEGELSTTNKLTPPSRYTTEEILRTTNTLTSSIRITAKRELTANEKVTSSAISITEGKLNTTKKLMPTTKSTTEGKLSTINKMTSSSTVPIPISAHPQNPASEPQSSTVTIVTRFPANTSSILMSSSLGSSVKISQSSSNTVSKSSLSKTAQSSTVTSSSSASSLATTSEETSNTVSKSKTSVTTPSSTIISNTSSGSASTTSNSEYYKRILSTSERGRTLKTILSTIKRASMSRKRSDEHIGTLENPISEFDKTLRSVWNSEPAKINVFSDFVSKIRRAAEMTGGSSVPDFYLGSENCNFLCFFNYDGLVRLSNESFFVLFNCMNEKSISSSNNFQMVLCEKSSFLPVPTVKWHVNSNSNSHLFRNTKIGNTSKQSVLCCRCIPRIRNSIPFGRKYFESVQIECKEIGNNCFDDCITMRFDILSDFYTNVTDGNSGCMFPPKNKFRFGHVTENLLYNCSFFCSKFCLANNQNLSCDFMCRLCALLRLSDNSSVLLHEDFLFNHSSSNANAFVNGEFLCKFIDFPESSYFTNESFAYPSVMRKKFQKSLPQNSSLNFENINPFNTHHTKILNRFRSIGGKITSLPAWLDLIDVNDTTLSSYTTMSSTEFPSSLKVNTINHDIFSRLSGSGSEVPSNFSVQKREVISDYSRKKEIRKLSELDDQALFLTQRIDNSHSHDLNDNDDISLFSSGIVKRAVKVDKDIDCRCCPRKSLEESRTISDFWTFAESTMIQLIYWNFWYHYMIPETHDEEDDKEYYYENQIMGVPRIRQVRVRNDSCSIHPSVSRFFDECFSYYSLYSEETRPIREDMEGTSTEFAWDYTDYLDLNTTYYYGKVSTYGGGGYYVDLSMDVNETIHMIKELRKFNWITKSTRAVFVDFTIYNVNVNLFCVCKIVFEFPPTGGMIPKADFASVKLLRYLNKFDFFILGCEFVFIILVIIRTVFLFIRMRKTRNNFFRYFWSYIDIFVLLLSYAFIIYGIVRFVIIEDFIENLPIEIGRHVDFWHVRNVQIYYNYLAALLVFFSWVQLVQYLNFTKTMMELRSTLRKSIRDIFGFALLFLIIFFAFAQVAFLMFGSQLEEYSTLWNSCMTLFQAVIGEFEYRQLEDVNRVLAPIFFIIFIFFIFFILMNMFLAIINDSYSAVKSEVDLNKVKTEEFLRNAYWNVIGLIFCGLDKKLKKKGSKRHTYEEIKRLLQRSGFSEAEIDMFFRIYNIDLNEIINETENRRIINDLELKGLDFNITEEQARLEELNRKVDRLNDKISEMQKNLHPVMHKIDLILSRLTL